MKISFKQHLTILLSIMVVLILVLVLSPLFSSTKMVARESQKELFPHFKSSLINGINIKKGNQEVSLVRKNQRWFVIEDEEEILANGSIISSFLDGVKAVKTGRLVSKGASHLLEYGLDEQNSINVEFHDEKDNGYMVLVGNEDETFQRRYVMVDSKIYETKVPSGFTNILKKDWVDLRLFGSIDSTQKIISFSVNGTSPISNSQINYRIDATSEDGNPSRIWHLSDADTSCDSNEVEQLLRKLIASTANSFVTAKQKTLVGLDAPVLTISVTATDGIVYSLFVGQQVEGKDDYYVMNSSSNVILEISKTTLESLAKPIDMLIQK